MTHEHATMFLTGQNKHVSGTNHNSWLVNEVLVKQIQPKFLWFILHPLTQGHSVQSALELHKVSGIS